MRIGILGGSFDPPHLGHLEMAKAAQDFLNLEIVLFVPAASQWQKAHSAPADVRAHMTQLAIDNNPDWKVSLVDLDRGGDTYSVETIATFQKMYPEDELFFILGSDAANGLDKWKNAEDLKKMITFAVVERFDVPINVPVGFSFLEIPGRISAISSSDIRKLVKDCETVEIALQGLTPHEVSKYIATVGLYQ
jgi:nicotinate-nucleotide adenylyltransferase